MIKALKNLEKSFTVSASDMRNLMRDFHYEMERGLEGKKGSLKMIPAYVDKPTGGEKGRFIALDLGGTNFRILEIDLKGNGHTGSPKVMRFDLKKRYITGTGDELFDFIAERIKIFLDRIGLNREETLRLGFTFSFPVKQTGVASGKLLVWTKGFSAKGVIGKDVVRLLNDALARKSLRDIIRVSALANDTVGTMVAGSYMDRDCSMGVIIGTGTNACYLERTSKIIKIKNFSRYRNPDMIINIEWGNFDKLKLNEYDTLLDGLSDNPGEQILEKMVSGMYLGRLVWLVLSDLAGKGRIFKSRGPMVKAGSIKDFKTEYMSAIESDRSKELSVTGALLRRLGVMRSEFKDRRVVKAVCATISKRSSRIAAAAIAAVITKMDPLLTKFHTVAIDGSVYEKHPLFSKNMAAALKEIFGVKSRRIRIVLTKDGSGKGAAIIAAVASHQTFWIKRGILEI